MTLQPSLSALLLLSSSAGVFGRSSTVWTFAEPQFNRVEFSIRGVEARDPTLPPALAREWRPTTPCPLPSPAGPLSRMS